AEIQGHDGHADDHHGRRRLGLLATRPVDLLELGPALLEELDGARDRLLQGFEGVHIFWMRVRQDSNLQPPDLESGALAVRATDPARRTTGWRSVLDLALLVKRVAPARRAELLEGEFVRG